MWLEIDLLVSRYINCVNVKQVTVYYKNTKFLFVAAY